VSNLFSTHHVGRQLFWTALIRTDSPVFGPLF